MIFTSYHCSYTLTGVHHNPARANARTITKHINAAFLALITHIVKHECYNVLITEHNFMVFCPPPLVFSFTVIASEQFESSLIIYSTKKIP